MSVEDLLRLLIGGGGLGIGAIVSAWLTSRSKREVDLLDRSYKEITRLDEKINDLEIELKKEKGDNDELRRIIKELRTSMELLRKDLKKYEKKGDGE